MSRMPPVSPAATIATYSSLKMSGWRRRASEKRDAGLDVLAHRGEASRSLSFSVCSSIT